MSPKDHDVETAVEEIMEQVQDVGNDTSRFTVPESVEFYQAVASECRYWANTIASDIEEAEN